jgi:hypothetical protein
LVLEAVGQSFKTGGAGFAEQSYKNSWSNFCGAKVEKQG